MAEHLTAVPTQITDPPRYPTSQPHEMMFQARQFGWTLAKADNGLIFQEYEINTDEMRRKLVTSPEQMKKIFDDWFALRSAEVLSWSTAYFEAIQAAKEPADG